MLIVGIFKKVFISPHITTTNSLGQIFPVTVCKIKPLTHKEGYNEEFLSPGSLGLAQGLGKQLFCKNWPLSFPRFAVSAQLASELTRLNVIQVFLPGINKPQSYEKKIVSRFMVCGFARQDHILRRTSRRFSPLPASPSDPVALQCCGLVVFFFVLWCHLLRTLKVNL